jgi:hypothetical protein
MIITLEQQCFARTLNFISKASESKNEWPHVAVHVDHMCLET